MSETSHAASQVYNNGLTLISGQRQEPTADDFAAGYAMIEKAGETFPPALAHSAALSIMGFGEEHSAADDILKAAMSGFPPAVRGLAVMMLGQAKGQFVGAGLLRRAAQNGDWIAAFLLVREAMRGRYMARADELAALTRSLSAAVPFRAEIGAWAAAMPANLQPINIQPFSKEVCQAALKSSLKNGKAQPSTRLHDHPRIASMKGVLTPLECDYLMAMSVSLMQPSKVVDADQAASIAANYRTSDGAVLLPANMDAAAALIIRRLSLAAGIDPEKGEFLSLLRYKPGQEYRPHHDYLLPDAQDYSRIAASGQRKSTLLTYLNAGYDGGETAFPDLGITYKGGAGDSLLFDNVDENSAPIPASLHAGMPVLEGEKWLATLWCREKSFWPWVAKP